MYGTTFAIESAAADRVCASYPTLPLTENDIEFSNDARQVIAFGGRALRLHVGAQYGEARYKRG
jgi:hypothetical protein